MPRLEGRTEGFLAFAASTRPLGRGGRDEQAARVVTSLASDDASCVDGSGVFVDGGLAQV